MKDLYVIIQASDIKKANVEINRTNKMNKNSKERMINVFTHSEKQQKEIYSNAITSKVLIKERRF
jgi:hypothetical protein